MVVLKTVHIVSTPDVLGGKPRIEGRRISVEQVADYHEDLGWSVHEIADAFKLSPAEIHAALSYYHDHRDEIDGAIRRHHEEVEQDRAEQSALRRAGGLDDVMTPVEIGRAYGITDHAVRDAIRNHRIAARKSGGTWLIRREDAEARWGKAKSQ